MIIRDAILSDCGRYRTRLTRELWDERQTRPSHSRAVPNRRRKDLFGLHSEENRQARPCTFIMLNPSTADAEADDATIRRCLGFAGAWGCNRLIVVNLFSWRATTPEALRVSVEPVGPGNDEAILEAAEETVFANNPGPVVCAWGANGNWRDRSTQVKHLLHIHNIPVHCLQLTASGEPAHPLYLPKTAGPIPYDAVSKEAPAA